MEGSMNNLTFDDGTFISRGLVSLRKPPQDVFCKVGDIRIVYFPRPVKHKIVSYDLLYWTSLLRPEGALLSDYERYVSSKTGNSEFAFNDVPFEMKDSNSMFNLIRRHFMDTEAKGKRNRTSEESLALTREKNTFVIETEINDIQVAVKNIELKECYLLNSDLINELSSITLSYEVKFGETVQLVNKEINQPFKTSADLVELVKQDLKTLTLLS